MRVSCLKWILILTHINFANPEMVFLKRTDGQSVQLSCVPDPEQAGLAPTGVILSAETCQVQKDLLSTADSVLRISSAYQSRLKVTGGMDSSQLNVTISHLQHSDTGLYVCEFTYAVNKNPDHQSFPKNIFLFIEVKECSSYVPLLYIISAAVGLLLVNLTWLCAVECIKMRNQQKTQGLLPIYEEMKSGRQENGSPQNIHPGSAKPEETDPPEYTQVRHAQNHYACPRPTRMVKT
ncbi:uncharacterized protein LOC134012111 isoform X1 [Osmerus eperlanus]|uniref:uncharacterized protein LOC134012111 isoform X1 n=2 Tax=Osmerus eperlanus TaxID=29151 RepID=UPI002E158A7D